MPVPRRPQTSVLLAIDLMLTEAPTFTKLWNLAKDFEIVGNSIKVTAFEHLIALKLQAAKNETRTNRDLEDISNLPKLNPTVLSAALLLMREMPVAVVARHVKETDTLLWRMLKRHVEAAYPLADWSNVICVGCDEMSVRKGHNYVSVFCDLLGKRVLFAVKGRDKKVWEAFVQALKAHNGHPRAIREVSMDMSPSYIAGILENIGSQAVMVFDKFHVIAHVNDAVNAVRRAEIQLGGWEAKNALKGSRWIWLKNPENLTAKQKATQLRIGGRQKEAASLVPMGPSSCQEACQLVVRSDG